MPGFTVLEDRQQTFFGGQALIKRQVQLAGLNAEFTCLMGLGQALGTRAPVAILEQLLEDLRHAALLKDAPVRLQVSAGQFGLDTGAIPGAAKAGLALFELADQAVHVTHGLAALKEGQRGGFVQQGGEIGIGGFTDQFNV